jgi:addiction module HigA family antidote
MRPVHPGEVLREDFLAPLGLSVNAPCVALAVPATGLHEIVKERRGITPDTAARLARYFGGDAASWLVLQANYDLKTLATRKDIERKVHARAELGACAGRGRRDDQLGRCGHWPAGDAQRQAKRPPHYSGRFTGTLWTRTS